MLEGKISHFEFTFSVITIYCFSHPGMGKFFWGEESKNHSEDLKINQP